MPAGRPPMYKSPEELQSQIDGYFADAFKMDPSMQMMVPNPSFIPTITGLCLHCGFESRQSFYAYEDKPEFSYTIKRARMMIEMEYEKRLHGNSNAGAIFALKNFGWTDKQEIDQTIKGSINFRDAE
jgi:hypothetical protein